MNPRAAKWRHPIYKSLITFLRSWQADPKFQPKCSQSFSVLLLLINLDWDFHATGEKKKKIWHIFSFNSGWHFSLSHLVSLSSTLWFVFFFFFSGLMSLFFCFTGDIFLSPGRNDGGDCEEMLHAVRGVYPGVFSICHKYRHTNLHMMTHCNKHMKKKK